MDFGFSTFFFVKKTPFETIGQIVSSGIRTIELAYDSPGTSDLHIRFGKEIDGWTRQGIKFSLHGPFIETNLGSYYEEIRDYSKKRIKMAIDMASEVGCNPVVIHPGYCLTARIKHMRAQAEANFLNDLGEVVSYASDRQVRIALENVFMSFFFFTDLAMFDDLRAKVPSLGIALDIGHAYIQKSSEGIEDPAGSIIDDIRKVGIDAIYHIHLHNNHGTRDDHRFLDGTIDMKRILKELERLRYNGKIIIESYDMEEYGITPVIDKIRSLSAP